MNHGSSRLSRVRAIRTPRFRQFSERQGGK